MKIIHVDDDEELEEYNRSYNKGSHIFVFFYMPTCIFCNMMEPEWEELEKSYKNKLGERNILAKVRGDYAKKVNGNYKIDGFPTIYYANKDKDYVEYKGNRTKNDLEQFILDNIKDMKGGRRTSKNKDHKQKHTRRTSKNKKNKKRKSRTKTKRKRV